MAMKDFFDFFNFLIIFFGGEISPLGNQKAGATTCTHVFLGWKMAQKFAIFKQLNFFAHK